MGINGTNEQAGNVTGNNVNEEVFSYTDTDGVLQSGTIRLDDKGEVVAEVVDEAKMNDVSKRQATELGKALASRYRNNQQANATEKSLIDELNAKIDQMTKQLNALNSPSSPYVLGGTEKITNSTIDEKMAAFFGCSVSELENRSEYDRNKALSVIMSEIQESRKETVAKTNELRNKIVSEGLNFEEYLATTSNGRVDPFNPYIINQYISLKSPKKENKYSGHTEAINRSVTFSSVGGKQGNKQISGAGTGAPEITKEDIAKLLQDKNALVTDEHIAAAIKIYGENSRTVLEALKLRKRIQG